MAITDENKPNGVGGVNDTKSQTQTQTGTSNRSQHNGATNTVGGSIGFGVNPIFTMASNNGSEYTNKVANGLIEVYKQLPTNERPKVNILDKEVSAGLAYSSIVVSMPAATNEVTYFIVALESTGRAPMTASAISTEVNAVVRTSNQIPFIYTPDDAIDEILHDKIRTALDAEYGNGNSYISVDGLIVPNVSHDDDQMIVRIAAIAFNANRSEKALVAGDISDLNIRKARQQTPNTILKLESNLLKQTVKDEVDNPIRSDWQIELVSVDTSRNVTSLNLQNNKINLTRAVGFIDSIPSRVDVPTIAGMPPVTQIRLRPHIILASNSVYATTPGYTLLGLISSLVMTNDNMWSAALMPKDDKSNIRNVGALNIITNIENNQNGIGQALNLADKKLSPDEVYATIKQMYTMAPVVSYDIESFGPQTYYSSVFSIAAEPTASEAKWNAAADIIEAASWLTDGIFPKDYPLTEIFATEGVIVPIGKWSDKSGERDIRDIDAAFIATQTNDVDLINKWVLSGLPKSVGGLDSFVTRVDIISKLIPNAVISGKAIRVTYHAKFINTLMSSAASAGLNATYEPEIKFVEAANLNVLNNYLDSAGLTAQPSFAQQTTQAGPNYNTPYSNMGSYRY